MDSNHSSTERIQQLDMIRGLAVLGILWINIAVFGLPSGAYALPSYLGDAVKANIAVWAFSDVMVEGAMRGLFSCLFGASALLYLSENKLSNTGIMRVDYFYRRNMFLIFIGMIHAYILLWPFDVLYAYGLIGMFLYPLRRLSYRVLIVAGLALLIIGEITIISNEKVEQGTETQAQYTPENRQEQVTTANAPDDEDDQAYRNTQIDKYRSYSVTNMEEDIELHRSSYSKIFQSNLALVIEQQSYYIYTEHIFDIGAMMLLGMALLKLGILQGNRSKKFYFRLMLAGFITGIALRAPFAYLEIVNDFVPADPEYPEKVGFSFSRLPIMLGYIGLFLWLIKYRVIYHLFTPLAAVGKLALTNYIMQTIICIFLFYGFGLGLIGYFEYYQLLLLCLPIWIIQIKLSLLWLKYFKMGPFEWLWRSAVYMRWQPLLKQPASTPLPLS
jgi:uncharacterized protein